MSIFFNILNPYWILTWTILRLQRLFFKKKIILIYPVKKIPKDDRKKFSMRKMNIKQTIQIRSVCINNQVSAPNNPLMKKNRSLNFLFYFLKIELILSIDWMMDLISHNSKWFKILTLLATIEVIIFIS